MKNKKFSLFSFVFVFFAVFCTVFEISADSTKDEKDFRFKRPLYKHHFKYDVNHDIRQPEKVYLHGSFNGDIGQIVSKNPMIQIPYGDYGVDLNLPEGIYQYTIKLILGYQKQVLFDDKELSEKSLEIPSLDGHFLSNAFYSGPQPPYSLDNYETLGDIQLDIYENLKDLHDPNDLKFFSFISPSLVRIMFRIMQDTSTSVDIYYKNITDQSDWKKSPMKKIVTFSKWDFYSITLNDFEKENELVYFFKISDGVVSTFLGNQIFGEKEKIKSNPFSNKLQNSLNTPEWAYDAIWYEIFPDRFRNGDKSNDPSGTIDSKHWPDNSELDITNKIYGWSANLIENKAPDELTIKSKEEQQNVSYFFKENLNNLTNGGDIQGLIESLSYLKDLGVNALYLTPIFTGKKAHHYQTLDLRHIDDSFGYKDSYNKLENETDDSKTWGWSESDLLFLRFVKEAHKQGFKVVIDINLHSMHKDSIWFKDILKNREKSPYADWFNVYYWGKAPEKIGYWSWDHWLGNDEMPVFLAQQDLNYTPSLNEFLLSVIKRWLLPNGDPTAGVDGFRIDSPQSLPIFFLWDLHDFVKTYKPEALLIGENWHQSFIANIGNFFDGLQDMEWAEEVYNFFIGRKKSLPNYLQYLNTIFSFGSLSNIMSSWHPVDNHDTIRLVSAINNPKAGFHPGLYKYYEINQPTPLDWKKFYQIVTFQFTCFGAPLIYYGDEVGMWSGSDPLNRHPMLWQDIEGFSEQNLEVLHFYKRIIATRNYLEPLRRGDFKIIPLDEENGLFGFFRNIQNERLILIFNRSSQEKLVNISLMDYENGTKLYDYMNPNQVEYIESPDKKTTFLFKSDSKTYEIQNGKLIFSIAPWSSVILGSLK